MNIRPILAAACLLASACGPEPASEKASAEPLPKAICDRFGKALDELRARAAFEFNPKGEATISEEAWLSIGDAGRDQMAQLIAFNTACQSQSPTREQRIVIRNEMGRVLSERIVETSSDMGGLLGE